MPVPRKTAAREKPWWRTSASKTPALEAREGLSPKKNPSPVMRKVYGRGRARGSIRRFVMRFRSRFEKENGRNPTSLEIDSAVERQFTRERLEHLDPKKDPMMKK